jgi:hypothetical protein
MSFIVRQLPVLVTATETVSGAYAIAASFAKAHTATILASGEEVRNNLV